MDVSRPASIASLLGSLLLCACSARSVDEGSDGTDTGVGTAGTVCVGACEGDDDCLNLGNKAKCIGGGCFWFECDEDADCEMDRVCAQWGQTRRCTNPCTIDVDCGDTDHFACQAGACIYLGCLDDAECELDFGPVPHVCEPLDGLRQCVRVCAGPEDCLPEDSPQYTPADFECVDARCGFKGCTPANCWENWTCVAEPS